MAAGAARLDVTQYGFTQKDQAAFNQGAQLLQQLKTKESALHLERSAFIQQIKGTLVSSVVLKLNTGLNVSEDFWNQLLSTLANVPNDGKATAEVSLRQFATVTQSEFQILTEKAHPLIDQITAPVPLIHTRGFGGGKLPPVLNVHSAYCPKNLEGFYHLVSLMLQVHKIERSAKELQTLAGSSLPSDWKRLEAIGKACGVLFFNIEIPPPSGLKRRSDMKFIFIKPFTPGVEGQGYIFLVPGYHNFTMVDSTPISTLLKDLKKGNHFRHYEEHAGEAKVWPKLSFTATLVKPEPGDSLRGVISHIARASIPKLQSVTKNNGFLTNYEIGIFQNPDRILFTGARSGSCNFEVKFHIISESRVAYIGGLGEHHPIEVVLNVHIAPPEHTPVVSSTPIANSVQDFRNHLAKQLMDLWGAIEPHIGTPVFSTHPLPPTTPGAMIFPGGFNSAIYKIKELPITPTEATATLVATFPRAVPASSSPAAGAPDPLPRTSTVLAPHVRSSIPTGNPTPRSGSNPHSFLTSQVPAAPTSLKRGRDGDGAWEERSHTRNESHSDHKPSA